MYAPLTPYPMLAEPCSVPADLFFTARRCINIAVGGAGGAYILFSRGGAFDWVSAWGVHFVYTCLGGSEIKPNNARCVCVCGLTESRIDGLTD